MEVSYATMEAMGMLVKRLGQDARRLEKALAETMNASAEWKRIAEEMKKERNAEREALGIQAAKEAGKALGMVEGEGLRAAAQRVVKERDALREDLRREEESHEETAQLLKTVDQKVRLLTQERDALRAQLDTERERHKQTASILAQYAPKTMQIEPPPEATHDTPEGKQAAESAVKREPKPGDTVRLVRVPTQQDYPMVGAQWLLDYGKPGECGTVERLHINSMGVHVAAMHNGLQWPLSCVEVVKGGE